MTAVAGGNASVVAAAKASPSVQGAAAITVGGTTAASVSIAAILQGVGCQPGAGVAPGLPANVLNACGQLDVTLNVDPGTNTLAGVDLIMNCTGNGNSGQDTVVASQNIASGDVTPLSVSESSSPVILSVNTAAFNATTGVVAFRNAPCALKAKARLTNSAQNATTSTSITLNNVDVKILGNAFLAAANAEGNNQLTQANDANGLPWHAGSVTVSVIPVLYSGRTVSSVSITLPGLAAAPGSNGGTLVVSTAPFSATFTNTTGNVVGRVGQITLFGPNDANGFPTPITPQAVVIDANGNDLALADPPPPFVQASFRLDNTSPQPPLELVIPTRQVGWINGSYVFTGSGLNNAITADNYVSCGDGFANAAGAGYACAGQVGVSSGTVSGNSGSNGLTTFTFYSIPAASYPGFPNANGTSTSSTTCSTTGWTKISTGNDLAETINNLAYVVRVFEADKLLNSRCTDLANTRVSVNTGAWTLGKFGVDKTPPASAFVDSSASNPGGSLANMTIKIGEPVPTYNVSFQETVAGSGFSATPVVTKLTRLAIDPGTGAASTVNSAFGCPITFNAGNGTCGTSAIGGTLVVDASSSAGVSSGVDGYYTYTGQVLDQARNAAPTLTRTIVIDRAAPVMGGVGVPGTLVGGATASFATSATDNLDLISTDFSLTYALNPTGNPAGAFLIRANGPTLGTAFDNVLTTSASFSLNVPGFIRNLQTTAAGGAPINNTAGLPTSITVRAYDAVGNVGPSAPAAIAAANVPQANLTNYALAQAGTGQTFQTWLVTNPATAISNCPTSGCAGGAAALHPSNFTITANAVGSETAVPGQQFSPPFTSVQFYYFNPAFGEWVFIGATSSAVGTDNTPPTQRTFTYSFSFTPPSFLPAGPMNLLAVGVNASGDALASPANANITLSNP